MITAPTNAGSAEVTVVETHGRVPLLLLLGSALVWLVASGVVALLTSIQLHSPQFLADCPWLTVGRTQAMRETMFIYGWAANVGLGTALWVLGRLGGYALRGLNWVVVGTLFWNLGVLAGVIGIAAGDMTNFSLLQLPHYVQPFLVFAYAAIAMSGVLAWSGRKADGMYASQWYAVAALFLFPWMLCAAQAVLLWMPVRGVVQPIAASWYAQGVSSLWLSPLALAGAYYVLPKVAGRIIPTYESAPLGFWTLIFIGAWTGGRYLTSGPVPAWVGTMAVVMSGLLLFHYLVIALNFRLVFGASGTAVKFLRVGFIAYILVGLLELITCFRGIAVETQFTFFTAALEELRYYGALSMMFFGTMYYMVPRITGRAWSSASLGSGHRVLVTLGVALSVIGLIVAGVTQGSALLDAKVSMADIFHRVRTPLLINSAAQLVLLAGNFLLLVNFCRTACVRLPASVSSTPVFRQPSAKLEVHAS